MKKYYLLTPGPTPVPHRVAAKSAEPILHHRTKEFGKVFDEVQDGMKYVMQTKNDILMIVGSGSAAMEASVANSLSAGDEILIGNMGSFGDRWEHIAKAYGCKADVIKEEWGNPVSPEKIADALKKKSYKAVLVQHTDTSTGTINDIKTIGDIVSKTDAILIVDSVSGLAGEELKMDEWKLDIVVSGSQKGLMTAPGLAMAAVSPKAWSMVEKSTSPRFYWDFRAIRKSIAKSETPWTPAVSLFQSLNEAIKMIREDGLEKVWARHKTLAKAARAGIQSLGFSLLSSQPCHVLTAAKLPEGFDGKKLIQKMLTDHGVSIAGGQEHLMGKIFRLAHMGYMDSFDMVVGLTALEKTLTEMGYKVPVPGRAIKDFEAALV